eukprot:scaffold1383_cov360-Prasinococcus_capsulatus_cf.AAC.2
MFCDCLCVPLCVEYGGGKEGIMDEFLDYGTMTLPFLDECIGILNGPIGVTEGPMKQVMDDCAPLLAIQMEEIAGPIGGGYGTANPEATIER